jgi:hypothetical protein
VQRTQVHPGRVEFCEARHRNIHQRFELVLGISIVLIRLKLLGQRQVIAGLGFVDVGTGPSPDLNARVAAVN